MIQIYLLCLPYLLLYTMLSYLPFTLHRDTLQLANNLFNKTDITKVFLYLSERRALTIRRWVGLAKDC
jgi:hypothetical protein